MKSEFRDDPFDAALGDRPAILPQFVCDNVGRRVRIQETVPDNLTHDRFRALRGSFGAALVRLQSRRPLFFKEVKQLGVALFGES
ncbi:MAG: hypothetical protein NT154_06275 [Verrucomicrobia bacterium]|nr:hypothetical protein [Verrucomicrobiota bacterium]